MFERDLVAKGCNTYKHCVIAIVVRIWILNLSCLRSERMSDGGLEDEVKPQLVAPPPPPPWRW